LNYSNDRFQIADSGSGHHEHDHDHRIIFSSSTTTSAVSIITIATLNRHCVATPQFRNATAL
jgi:hypothetical protein